MIIITANDIPDSQIHGSWKKIRDSSASINPVLKDLSGIGEDDELPQVKPKDYFEASFFAQRGVDYHLWVRMKAENNSTSHDSVYLQFSDTIDPQGNPRYRIDEYGNREIFKQIDLILAGHTHGGQVRIPFIKPIEISPNHKMKYDTGLFQEQGTKMYVNRGIGTALLPIRFLCPPEITVFHFVQERKKE
jgi:hypothetical protein